MMNKAVKRAVIECFQEIPCNPCASVCRAGAITMEELTSLPVFHEEKCTGCRQCVAACPGQAIFFFAEEENGEFCRITFPYEYLPLPQAGQSVVAVDRMGVEVCEGTVISVDSGKSFNKTNLVTIRIPMQFGHTVRFMKRLNREEE